VYDTLAYAFAVVVDDRGDIGPVYASVYATGRMILAYPLSLHFDVLVVSLFGACTRDPPELPLYGTFGRPAIMLVVRNLGAILASLGWFLFDWNDDSEYSPEIGPMVAWAPFIGVVGWIWVIMGMPRDMSSNILVTGRHSFWFSCGLAMSVTWFMTAIIGSLFMFLDVRDSHDDKNFAFPVSMFAISACEAFACLFLRMMFPRSSAPYGLSMLVLGSIGLMGGVEISVDDHEPEGLAAYSYYARKRVFSPMSEFFGRVISGDPVDIDGE
jgi:hypothetical protein